MVPDAEYVPAGSIHKDKTGYNTKSVLSAPGISETPSQQAPGGSVIDNCQMTAVRKLILSDPYNRQKGAERGEAERR